MDLCLVDFFLNQLKSFWSYFFIFHVYMYFFIFFSDQSTYLNISIRLLSIIRFPKAITTCRANSVRADLLNSMAFFLQLLVLFLFNGFSRPAAILLSTLIKIFRSCTRTILCLVFDSFFYLIWKGDSWKMSRYQIRADTPTPNFFHVAYGSEILKFKLFLSLQ